jgi:hypothetical protein
MRIIRYFDKLSSAKAELNLYLASWNEMKEAKAKGLDVPGFD